MDWEERTMKVSVRFKVMNTKSKANCPLWPLPVA
jgi:hypothetical protein